MYKLKEKWKNTVMKYSMNTNLDINGSYTKEEWNKNGFKDLILEKI